MLRLVFIFCARGEPGNEAGFYTVKQLVQTAAVELRRLSSNYDNSTVVTC